MSVNGFFHWLGRRCFQLGLFLLAAGLISHAAIASEQTEPFKVLASIKPLQLIAQAVTAGVTDTQVLLPAGATPHDYALKPSDLRRVYDADLLLWLGAPFEPYLAKPVKMRSVTDLAVLNFDDTTMREHHDKLEHGGPSHLYNDLHVWFGPDQALAIATSLKDILVLRDAVHATQYQANLAVFASQLRLLDDELRARFSAGNEKNYLVYHDAYSYFEAHYGLSHVAQVTEQPDSKPGAKSLLKLRKLILNGDVACLFIEPQADRGVVSLLQENTGLKVYQLDPMATGFDVSATAYLTFLSDTADRFSQCR